MTAGDLRSVIEATHASTADPIVDRAVFGTDRPEEIERLLSGFCESTLGARIASARFYRVSAACVAGVALDDGREVVIKAQRGQRKEAYLRACTAFRRRLLDQDFPCPRPLAEATRVGPAWVLAEELVTRGSPGDAHEPSTRRAIVGSLVRLASIGEGFSEGESLGRAWFSGLPEGQVFPRPHSPAFDFEGSEEGAEWIVALAREARAVRAEGGGEARVVGHFDYRVEHLRFEGGRVVATFDWDSLHFERLAVWIGALTPHFTTDWQRDDLERAPSIDEMRAFVADFEALRGQAFSKVERRLLAASCVYGAAYTARCNHAASPRDEGWNGDLRPLLRAHGRRILEHGL